MQQESPIVKAPKWDRANFLSKVFFIWVWPLFLKGHKKDLEFKDLYQHSDRDEASKVANKLEKKWENELKRKKPSFARAVFSTFLPEYMPLFFIYVIQECVVRVSQPLFLGMVVRYLENPTNGSVSHTVAIWSAVGIVGCTAFFITVNHITMACAQRIGYRMRVASCTLMYRKSIKLSHKAMTQTAVGQVVNIMSSDVTRFDDVSYLMHAPIVSPMQSVLIMVLLWEHLNLACLTGVAVLVLFVPFQAIMGRLFQAVRRKTAVITDRRIRIMSELISGMRVIKMYTWEMPFARLVDECRRREIYRIKQASYLKAINQAIYFQSSRIILFACFVSYVYLVGPLKPESIFVSMAYFNTMRITVTKHFPNSIASIAETLVSCKRIEKFMLLEEIDRTPITNKSQLSSNKLQNGQQNGHISVTSGSGVYLHGATARWDKEMKSPTFRKISTYVKQGELLAVIGPVGSGKSSLLMALLHELPLESGHIEINGTVSYASQEPWAYVASVRDNILFGSEYDPVRYQEVVRVCALERDLEQFPYGDQTLVGEKGVSLSGGQKTRITLARALYKEADIYLLDDPLSAVDTHVSTHIFKKCIKDHLKNKVRILVTHQLQYLQSADRILILRDSEAIACGTYKELKEQGINFSSFVTEKKEQNKQMIRAKESMRMRTLSWSHSIASSESELSVVTHTEPMPNFDEDDEVPLPRKHTLQLEIKQNGKVTEEPKLVEESKQSGSIQGRVYWEYARSSQSPFMLIVATVSMIVSQVMLQGSDIWLTEWTKKVSDSSSETFNSTKNIDPDIQDQDSNFFVLVYTGLICAMFVATMIRTTSFFVICMRASVNLHNFIFTRLLHTPISHFDQNPSGRILNRFSKDMCLIDESLPMVAYDLQVTITTVLGITAVNTYTNPYLIIPGIILVIFVILFRSFYIRSARDIKRLESIARSPFYSHVNNTLSGLTTVRTFGAEKWFVDQFYHLQNVHSSAWFLIICTSRGFGVLMDWLCLIYITTVTIFVMSFPGVFASYAGLALSSSIMLTGMTQWGVRCSADLESYMTSVERVIEYTQLESEEESNAQSQMKVLRAPRKEQWPSSGEVAFDQMTLFYDGAQSPVLKKITCHIEGGSKVGVVGRTGAGKSSLISALFRMCRRIEGTITIDGIETSQLSLSQLRRSISIIPQDPLIFTGTIRYNIDPFSEHSDERLWEVLEEVQLMEVIRRLPGQLSGDLSEGGANFSVGQRQLICLARAILRDNKILLLDEATANVDQRTDQLIQRTIRKRFAKCTVITVAHRLNTIIDSDKILVLDAGNLVEFDSPYELLRKPESLFTSLVEQTGKRVSRQLYRIAQEVYFGHHCSETKFEEEGHEEEDEIETHM